MTFLPIVERHLRVLSRKGRTYWSRVVVALGFTILAMSFIWDGRWSTPAQLGQELFEALSITVFIVALLAGAIGSADSISSEKREGTLGLLFLTDLNGFDIVLGKLAASGIEMLYVICAALPVMALPLLMGGVTGSQLWQMGLVVLNSMFFALCVGLFISAISRSARAAVLGTIALVAFFTVGIVALEAVWHELTHQSYYEPFFGWIGPLLGFLVPFARVGMGIQAALYWQSVVSTHLLAWIFLLAAARIVPRVWQEKGLTVRRLKWRERLVRWSVGNAQERKAYRSAMLDLNPICWLDDRYRLQKSLLWAALLVAITFGMWMFSLSLEPENCLRENVVFQTVLTTQGILLVWLAFAATYRLAEDKRSGALELLLATPISVREILQGRLLALRRQFGWVFAVVCVGMALLFAGMIYFKFYGWRGWGYDWNYVPTMTALGIAGLMIFLLDALAIAMAGQVFALTARNSVVATIQTLIAVVGVHWSLFFASTFTWVWVKRQQGMGISEWHVLGFWFVIGVANSLFWTWRAWYHLNTHFRRLASNVPAQTPIWKRLAQWLNKPAV